MMNYRIHPAAEREAENAAEWYAVQVPTLAIEFARQHQLAIDWIIESPTMYPLAEDAPEGIECRNIGRLGRFPYRVIYAIAWDGKVDIAIVEEVNKHEY